MRSHRDAVIAASTAMPGRLGPFHARLRTYSGWALTLTLAFAAVYGGLNWWTAERAFRFRLHGTWELAIPHVPEAALAYVSIQLLFLLPLWVLSVPRIARLGRAMLAAIVSAGVVFALLPTELGFARAVPDGWLAPLYRTIFALDLPHNLFPSLHVALCTLVMLFLVRDAHRRARALYLLWWLALAVSVLLTHQHHLLDVAGGLALGLASYAGSRDGRFPPGALRGA